MAEITGNEIELEMECRCGAKAEMDENGQVVCTESGEQRHNCPDVPGSGSPLRFEEIGDGIERAIDLYRGVLVYRDIESGSISTVRR